MSSSPSSPLSPKRARTRASLVEATLKVIAEKGFHRTTLDEIAARAGMTKGAVYANFESKDALFLAAVAASTHERIERFAWPTDRSGTVKQRLRRLAQAVLDDEPSARAEAPLRAEFLLYTLTHEEMRERIAAFGPERIGLMEQRLLEMFDPAELPVAPDKFAILLEAMIPGLIFMRAQIPGVVTDEAVFAAFEALALAPARTCGRRRRTAPRDRARCAS
jgi:AcrR family transcriptional regulator